MAGTAGAIRAGRAFVEMFLDQTNLEQGLNKVSARLKAFGSWTRGNASLPEPLASIAQFIASPAGIATGLAGLTLKAAEFGDELDRMSQRTGVGVESLSRLQYAATMMDVPFNDLATAIGKMQKSIVDDKAGLGGMLGGTTEDQFMAVADMLAAIPDPALRAAKAMEIFGKSGAALLPFIGEGSGKVKAMMDEANRLGFTMDAGEVEKLAQVDDSFKRMNLSIGNLVNTIGAALAPIISRLADFFGSLVRSVRDFTKNNERATQVIFDIAAGLAAAGIAASALAEVVPMLGPIFAFISPLLGGIIANPILLVGAAIAALVAALAGAGGAFDGFGAAVESIFSRVVQNIRSLYDELSEVAGGAFDAASAGDWGLAWKIAVAGLSLEWARLKQNVGQVWAEILDTIGGVITKIAQGLMGGLAEAWGWIKKRGVDVFEFLGKAFVAIFGRALQSIMQTIGDAMTTAGEGLKNVWGGQAAGEALSKAGASISKAGSKANEQGIKDEANARRAQIDKDTTESVKSLNKSIADMVKSIMDAMKVGGNDAEVQRLRAELDALLKQADAMALNNQKPLSVTPGNAPLMEAAGSRGGFSSQALFGYGMGNSPLEQIAKNTARQIELTSEGLRIQKDSERKADERAGAIQIA